MSSNNNKRPKYLNLLKIRMPVSAVTSILHRLSGLILFLTIPVLIYSLQKSLGSEAGYQQIVGYFSSPLVKIIVLLVIWALLHHLLAGIRFLFIDFDIGVDKSTAFKTAWLVSVAAAVIIAFMAWKVLL